MKKDDLYTSFVDQNVSIPRAHYHYTRKKPFSITKQYLHVAIFFVLCSSLSQSVSFLNLSTIVTDDLKLLLSRDAKITADTTYHSEIF